MIGANGMNWPIGASTNAGAGSGMSWGTFSYGYATDTTVTPGNWRQGGGAGDPGPVPNLHPPTPDPMLHFQRYFRDCPPSICIELFAGAGNSLSIVNPSSELLDNLDLNIRIVRGLDDCDPGLALVQLCLYVQDDREAGERLRHGQTTHRYLENLIRSGPLATDLFFPLPHNLLN